MRRDYNEESKDNNRKYFYNFDYDVMHKYMVQAFSDYFVPGDVLELGSFKGAFTKRLLPYFDHITCVEASTEAVEAARKDPSLKDVTIIPGLFEETSMSRKYENILLVHVLEHIEDRVGLLRKVRDEWLAEGGRFIVACPNAYAPSRQIAVKMGLISNPEVVTLAEMEHGHRVTYSIATLGQDIEAAGLRVHHCSGIFFKGLANFQWDKLLDTDIVSQEYLDGCYELGKDFPDLCATIYYVCEK